MRQRSPSSPETAGALGGVETGMKRILLLAGVVLATVSCLGSDFEDSLEGEWRLTSGTVEGDDIPILDESPVTMTLADGQASGTAACNGYGGDYDLSGGSITFGDLIITEMACSPDEIMTAERLFMQGLTQVSTVELDGDLVMRGQGVELVFTALEPVEDAELQGTVWVLDGLITGETASSAMGEGATLEFFSDGSVLGDTGCRPFSGQHTVEGAQVTIEGLAGDGEECAPDIADQDAQILSVLDGTVSAEIDGRLLTIMGSDGNGLTFLAEE